MFLKTLTPKIKLQKGVQYGTFKDPCCRWRVRELTGLIKNIFIFVLKMNKGLKGLEQHEGE